jgi:Family of unknown function (DUF5681)
MTQQATPEEGAAMADNAAEKQRRCGPGRPFQPGKSGNPTGKRKGTRHRVTLLAEKLMADDTEAVVHAVVKAAKTGDMTAARLVLDRIAPARKGRPVSFPLPTIETTADVTTALSAVVASMASGALTPDEATTVASVIEVKRKAIEMQVLENRIVALEHAAEVGRRK